MFNKIEDAINDLKNGKLIVVIDNEDRENEGDLVGVGDIISKENINFMIKYGRGLVCVPLEEKRAKELDLTPMVFNNSDSHQTAFTVSVDS
ncbi:3,4-dihydroxy-2-butanone-4-phosphate synthase, partial [Cetobacterium sp.]